MLFNEKITNAIQAQLKLSNAVYRSRATYVTGLNVFVVS